MLESARRRPPKARGWTLLEALVALTVIAVGATLVIGGLGSQHSRLRTRFAARQMSALMAELRWKSVASDLGHGLLFGVDDAGWNWVVVRDDNRNGVRVADARQGVDPVVSGPHRLGDRFSGVDLGIPDIGRIPRVPPASGSVLGGEDPVRFGRSDLIAFSSLGRSSSGTLYVTDGRSLCAVVVFGPTCRVRVACYEETARRWRF